MPKKFIFILLIFQALLSYIHWLLFKSLVFFFPALLAHSTGLISGLMVLSVSFFIFSVLIHNYDNLIFRAGYIIAAVWLVAGFYLQLALLGALIAFGLGASNLSVLGTLAYVTALLLTLYGIINARYPRIIPIKVKLSTLPKAWKTRTAVMVSDLHLGQVLRTGSSKKTVGIINALNPDIVFIPGDFYDGVHTDFEALANEFKNIKAPFGTYFSSGNHEMFAGYDICERAIKQAGIKILEDEKVEIDGLQIVGLAYRGETDASVKKILAKISIDKNKPSILLKHVPNHLAAVEQSGISLQLSGHTHRGQVWPFRYITKRVFKGYDYGHKIMGGMQIYTSSGIGTWGPPMRVFTKSEIIKITFE